MYLMYFCQVLRIRSELRKRKLTSVCVERVLNVQGTVLSAAVANITVVFKMQITVCIHFSIDVSIDGHKAQF